MVLFENFNLSNQSSPWFEKHENFVVDLKPPGCKIVQNINFEDRCPFVQESESCKESVQIFDYISFLYCRIETGNNYAHLFGIFLLFLMGYYICLFVEACTEKFFLPPLKIITFKLGISESFAGVTILAFGNSTPDLVASLVTGISGEAGTAFSDLMGSAMFVTTLVTGTIIWLKPLKVEAATFTRDIAFHILAILYIDYAIKSDRHVTISESILIVSIYFAYLVIVIADEMLLAYTLKGLRKAVKDDATGPQALRLKQLEEEAKMEIRRKSKVEVEVDMERHSKKNLLFVQFWHSCNPIEMEEWHEGGKLTKFCIICKIPIHLILFVLLPQTDVDLHLNGWSRLMNCMQIVTLPLALLSVHDIHYRMFGMPFWLLILLVTVPLAVTVFFLTETDTCPKFHLMFSIFSIVGSIYIIKILAEELLSIIDVVGIVTYLSTSFLGCTVLSWGKCFGNLVASIELAQQGYQKMGLTSCIAGPLFYLTLGLGFTYLYESLKDENHVFEASQGSMGENCTVFVMLNLLLMLIGVSTTNFYLRRSLGIFLIMIYLLFCFYCLLGEYQLIHPFGTDHSEDVDVDVL